MQVPEAEFRSTPVERRRSAKNRLRTSEEWKGDGIRKRNTHYEEKHSPQVGGPGRDRGTARLTTIAVAAVPASAVQGRPCLDGGLRQVRRSGWTAALAEAAAVVAALEQARARLKGCRFEYA